MPSSTYCPLCYTKLEIRVVAPCMECGGNPEEIAHFKSGKHTFHELELFPNLSLILCNFCMVDFGSYDPGFFGLEKDAPLGFEYMKFTRDIVEPSLGKDKLCPNCGYRLKFLNFVSAMRERNRS